MKKFLLVALLALTGCSEDKLKVIHNNDRVSDLERRMQLNEELDAAQSASIQANADAIAAEALARESGDQALQDLLDQEEAARVAGDQANAQALSNAVAIQSLVNLVVQGQLALINSKFPTINNKLASLQNQLNNTNNRIDDLENEMQSLASELEDLEGRLEAAESAIANLSSDLAETQAQLDQEGVKVYKCNDADSTERIFKINGKFYAARNRITTQAVNVVTGSTSQTFTTPDMCKTYDGKLELPNSGGQCTPNSGPFKSTKINGTSIVVPSYSTASVNVVTSVKIAIDLLSDGSYTTTDGGPACSFSISNGGTSSSNLTQVQ